MASAPDVIAKIDLGANGVYSFRTLEEIEKWTQSERSFWSWLGSHHNQQTINQLWANYNEYWNKISNGLQSARQRNDISAGVRDVTPPLQQYRQENILHSSNPLSKFIYELKNTKPLIAAYALCYIHKLNLNMQSVMTIEAVYEVLKFKDGIINNIDAEKNRLEELAKRYVDIIEKYKDELNILQREFEIVSSEISDIRLQQQGDFGRLIEASEAKLKEVQEIYDKKLALQASVSYWQSKYKKHLMFSIYFGIAAFVSALLGVGIIRLQYNEVVRQAIESTAQSQKIEYLRLSMVIIVVSFVLWFVRILVRILLSHIHLGTDANERVTMIQTYLALLREGDSLQENEKQVILQTLFRPSADGIVKDDGVPPSIAELLSKTTAVGK